MRLTEQQRHDQLWIALKAHLEERLAAHRLKNDAPLSSEETGKLRGRIEELKYLLSLEKPEPPAQEPYKDL